MEEFKSKKTNMIANFFWYTIGFAFLGFILQWFLDFEIALGIAGVIWLIVLYFNFFGDNIRIIVEPNRLAVYRGKKLKHEFKVSEVAISAKIRNDDYYLYVNNGEKTTDIDCSLLGRKQFERLLDSLKVGKEPIKIETKKKEN